jgi:hypothetical protein
MSPWNIAFLVMVLVAFCGYPLILGAVAWWSNRAPARPQARTEPASETKSAKAEYPKAA